MACIAGVSISNLSLSETLERILSFVRLGVPRLVVTANPEILVTAYKDVRYKEVLQSAALVTADGVGVVLASYLTKEPLTKGRVIGVDIVENLMVGKGVSGYSVFLLGSSIEVLQKATHNISLKYGKTAVVGYESAPMFADISELDSNHEHIDLINRITSSHADILLVGFGHPKQELWLNKYLAQTGAKVGIGVGGSFDYISGVAKRPGPHMRKVGLEWVIRLFKQPIRYKRIINASVVFPSLFIRERLFSLFHVEH